MKWNLSFISTVVIDSKLYASLTQTLQLWKLMKLLEMNLKDLMWFETDDIDLHSIWVRHIRVLRLRSMYGLEIILYTVSMWKSSNIMKSFNYRYHIISYFSHKKHFYNSIYHADLRKINNMQSFKRVCWNTFLPL